jgi:hypothetical protein
MLGRWLGAARETRITPGRADAAIPSPIVCKKPRRVHLSPTIFDAS